ncbi:MAG: hypothetical protein IT353_02840 [Gemmatimonadaceae bacterium]|nr:hypothetical protein [Gemmatimonadaceae bacterium]
MSAARGSVRAATLRWVMHLGAMVGAATMATPASAQRPANDTLLAPRRLRPVWRVGVEAANTYESNVLFGGLQQALGDQYRQLGATLSGGVATARTRIELQGRGDVVRFATLRDLDRETYDVGAVLTRKWSPRVASHLSGRAVTATMSTAVPQLNPTLLPLTITRTQSAVASVAARPSAQLDLTSALDVSRIRFDDTTFIGGTTTGGAFALAYRTGARSQLGAISDVRVASFNRQEVGTARFEAEVRHEVGRIKLRASGGATVLQTLAVAGSEPLTSPTGSFEVSRRQNSVAVVLQGSRAISAAFGLGRALQTDQLVFSVERAGLRGNTVRLSADASRNEDPTDPRLSLQIASVNAEMRRALGGGLSLAIVGFARRRLEGVRITNTGASLTVSFGGGR